MTTDEPIERAARIIADAALDWTDIENGEHEHSPECANWQPYTHEARAVLAVFEQAQAEPEWEYGLCEEDPRERPHRAYNGAHLVSDNRAYVEAQHRRGHPSIKFVRRRKAGPWGSVDVSDE